MKKLNTFTAIDFETASGESASICQVGLVRVENGVYTKEINLLVQPPNNFYWSRFIDIHGITPQMTLNAPLFKDIWHEIEPYITNHVVVAHNGKSFDFPVLKKTLAFYNIENPNYVMQDTYKIYGEKLSTLCKKHKIELKHHDALSDAKACAELYLNHLNN
ncbi:3'-5' exonuclease [Flavobacterium davisii]|uniref:3'-5' exonuclease n=1 Tax=Flavobacterium davisii TaxID=2906077 RepID=UPI0035CEB8F3